MEDESLSFCIKFSEELWTLIYLSLFFSYLFLTHKRKVHQKTYFQAYF